MKAILQHMLIQIHNTLSGQKEGFKPLEENKVGIYSCGPTVYDTAHIGNLRTYVSNDLIRRIFEYNGYFVKHVMNITDIEYTLAKDIDDNEVPLVLVDNAKYLLNYWPDTVISNNLQDFKIVSKLDITIINKKIG